MWLWYKESILYFLFYIHSIFNILILLCVQLLIACLCCCAKWKLATLLLTLAFSISFHILHVSILESPWEVQSLSTCISLICNGTSPVFSPGEYAHIKCNVSLGNSPLYVFIQLKLAIINHSIFWFVIVPLFSSNLLIRYFTIVFQLQEIIKAICCKMQPIEFYYRT